MKLVKNLVFIFIAIFFINSLLKNIFNFQKKYQFYLEIKNQYEELKKKNIELKTQFLRKNDPVEIEKKAREKLNLSREGEVIIILPQPTPTPTVITPTPPPNWQKWWQLYFGK